MAGIKRLRTENDSSPSTISEETNRIAPQDYSFNFIPTLKPSQKLFDTNLETTMTHVESGLKPVEFSVTTLTHRFYKRSQKFKLEKQKKQVDLTVVKTTTVDSATNTQYEPMYLRHQDISYTIITYLQMSFNIIISATVLYIFAKMILVVKQDFRLKAQEHVDALHREKLECMKNYEINHCGQDDRVPGVVNMCNDWAACIQKDIVVAQAKVSAETIAEIINSFVEPISYKTLIFFSLLVLGSLVFSNLAFGIFRRKYNRPLPPPNHAIAHR